MGLDFEVIASLTAEEQVQTVADLQTANERGYSELGERPDFRNVLAALNAGDPNVDELYRSMDAETVQLRDRLEIERREAAALPFYLYMHSSDEGVRDQMEEVVDGFIESNFGVDPEMLWVSNEPRISELERAHNILQLMTMGGNHNGGGLLNGAFTFHAQNDAGEQVTTPYAHMEKLEHLGAIEISGESAGGRLTPIGYAVLQRLDETLGEAKFCVQFTHPSGSDAGPL